LEAWRGSEKNSSFAGYRSPSVQFVASHVVYTGMMTFKLLMQERSTVTSNATGCMKQVSIHVCTTVLFIRNIIQREHSDKLPYLELGGYTKESRNEWNVTFYLSSLLIGNSYNIMVIPVSSSWFVFIYKAQMLNMLDMEVV
jgi:hypothetical protein